MKRRRRRVAAVVGTGEVRRETRRLVEALGQALVDAGFRIVTGGLGGVMDAASRGARRSSRWCDGTVVAILPGTDAGAATPYADIVIPTGLGVARNVLVVASADVVVAVEGGAGTLSEIAVAWQFGKPIVALDTGRGWATRLAGTRIDERRADVIARAATVEEAVAAALRLSGGP